MMDDAMKRDRLDVASEDEAKTSRPVFTPKIGTDFMRNFLKPRKVEEEQSQDAEPEAPSAPKTPEELEAATIEMLKDVYDPEIPVNIYELGLIYGVEADDNAHVVITMTLTSPHCPVAESMPADIEERARAIDGVEEVTLNLVWDPPWDMSRMSDEARLELGLL